MVETPASSMEHSPADTAVLLLKQATDQRTRYITGDAYKNKPGESRSLTT
ncbi:MAG: hypothetical protein LBD55_02800 [Treponema sp.]|nr:hypothetical protein [Treponema sp.]